MIKNFQRSWLDKLNPIKSFAEGIGSLIDRFVQSPDERAAFYKEIATLEENAEAMAQKAFDSARDAYKTEWENSDHTSKFDKFVDGVNRLIRPAITIGIIAAILGFVEIPANIPEKLWYLAMIVFGFWFGGRLLKKDGGVDAIKALKK